MRENQIKGVLNKQKETSTAWGRHVRDASKRVDNCRHGAHAVKPKRFDEGVTARRRESTLKHYINARC